MTALQQKFGGAKEPWEIIAWTPEQEQMIYREWGNYFSIKQNLGAAVHYYNKSLHLRPNDATTLYRRSVCMRKMGKNAEALRDAKAAVALDPTNAVNQLELCDVLYDLNQFENCKMELHDNSQRFRGRQVDPFPNRLLVIHENYNDILGKELEFFVLRNRKAIEEVQELKRQRQVVDRPLWKVLKDEDKCDVLSVIEKEEVLKSPLEIAQRQRAINVIDQIYSNRSWEDISFINKVRRDPNLLIPQCIVSTPLLKLWTNNRYTDIIKHMEILRDRCPLYTERVHRSPNKKLAEALKEARLFHIQYQTRRDMFKELRTLHSLRAKGELEKLVVLAENFMGNYVTVKTKRVMPWKLELMNEVYNLVALSHTDQFVIPADLKNVHPSYRLLVLLRLPTTKMKGSVKFVFGQRGTFHEADAVDPKQIAYKKFVASLERGLHFAEFSIEKCYLLHEIARSHLLQNRYDECCKVARKAIEESKNCNSNIWRFLSIMLIVKAHASLHKIEHGKAALEEAKSAVASLKSPKLTDFVEICCNIQDEELLIKRRQSFDSIRFLKNRFSAQSMLSLNSSTHRK